MEVSKRCFVGENGGQRFKTVMSVFVSAAFAYSGVEMTGLAAAEALQTKENLFLRLLNKYFGELLSSTLLL